jgi:hypothetical protein
LRVHGGCITLNLDNGYNLNDPDGSDAQVPTSSVAGVKSISGVAAPGAGYLVGVFIAAGGPSGPAPRALDFTRGLGTTRTGGAPSLD